MQSALAIFGADSEREGHAFAIGFIMVFSFIKGLMSKSGARSSAIRPTVSRNFEVYNAVDPALGGRLAAFLQTGEDRSVLSWVKQANHQLAQIRANNMRNGIRPSAKETKDMAERRVEFLLDLASPQELVRLAEIRAIDGYFPLAKEFPQFSVLGFHILSEIASNGLESGAFVANALKSLSQIYGQDIDAEEKNKNLTQLVAGAFAELGLDRSEAIFTMDRRYINLNRVPREVEAYIRSATKEEYLKALSFGQASDRETILRGLCRPIAAVDFDKSEFMFAMLEDGSAAVRSVARKYLHDNRTDALLDLYEQRLDTAKSQIRAEIVTLLASFSTERSAAILAKLAKTEKSSRILALIKGNEAPIQKQAEAMDSETSYRAVDGSVIQIEIRPDLELGSTPTFQKSDIAELQRAIDADLEIFRLQSENNRNRKSIYAATGRMNSAKMLELLADIVDNGAKRTGLHITEQANVIEWFLRKLDQIPPGKAVRLAMSLGEAFRPNPWWKIRWVEKKLTDGTFDLRQVVRAYEQPFCDVNKGIAFETNREVPPSLERWLILGELKRSYQTSYFDHLPPKLVQSLIFKHFPAIELHLPPFSTTSAHHLNAMRLLKMLPALPEDMAKRILQVTFLPAKEARVMAQQMLKDIDGMDHPLIDALSEKAQAARIGAASFMALRGKEIYLPALSAAVKKEKSAPAKTAMLAAIKVLGGDTREFVSPKTIADEAQAVLKKGEVKALSWLDLTLAPHMMWKDQTTVQPETIAGLLAMAVKVKDAEGASMFRAFLDEFDPAAARALGDWILTAWIAYDTVQHDRASLLASYVERVKQARPSTAPGSYYAGKSDEEIAAIWLSQSGAAETYLNSGAESKGILWLAQAGTPAVLAKAGAGYMKNHAKRPSQAKAILDLMALADAPETLQVVVATGQRLKQQSVREYATDLVTKVAEARGWTKEELADRTLPTGGLDETGQMELLVGEEAKPYLARLDSDLTVRVFNPDGKEVKSIPAGSDENSKESKALLSALKATVKTAEKSQVAGLKDAMAVQRMWSVENWLRDLHGHPIMKRLSERLIWVAYDEDGVRISAFRPTAEGDFISVGGDDVAVASAEKIGLAHACLLGAEEAKSWCGHLADFDVVPLFDQMARPVHAFDDAQAGISDRKGWVMNALRLRSEMEKRAFRMGPAMDGGWSVDFIKDYPAAGIVAVIEMSGTGPGASPDDTVAVFDLAFFPIKNRYQTSAIALGKLPPVLVQECWNDLLGAVEKGTFDPEWKKKF